jgi:hypothetical protein
VPWTYALRLLRVTLSLQSATSHDLSVALHHLKLLIDLADKNRDFAMIVAFATLEALVHLRTDSPDLIMNCQESIAKARGLQMRKGAEELKQVWVILSCADLACSLIQCNVNEASTKLKALMPQIQKQVETTWPEDGSIAITLTQESTNQLSDFSSGIFRLNTEGQAMLSIRWLDRSGVYAFGFLLGACSGFLKNILEERNIHYIDGGLEVLDRKFELHALKALHSNLVVAELAGQNLSAPDSVSPASRADIQGRSEINVTIQWYLNLYQAFLHCHKADWGAARQVLNKLDLKIQKWNFQDAATLRRWTTYLHGVVEQGTGNAESAAQIFRSPILMNAPQTGSAKNKRVTSIHDDISILSRLNLLFILRSPDRPPTSEAQQLLSELKEMVPSSHYNPVLRSSLGLISAVLDPRDPIATRKEALRSTLESSRVSGNTQLLAVSMTAMVSIFFTDITAGNQPRAARNAALVITQRAGDPLWHAVASGLCLQGELDPKKIADRHTDIDKAIGQMDEKARTMFLNPQDGAMDED